MKPPQEWDELLTTSPMNAEEALQSVRIKPEEIEAIQADARTDILAVIKRAKEALEYVRFTSHEGDGGTRLEAHRNECEFCRHVDEALAAINKLTGGEK